MKIYMLYLMLPYEGQVALSYYLKKEKAEERREELERKTDTELNIEELDVIE